MSVYGSHSEYIKSMSKGVQDFTNNGECSCCGECCGNILPLTKDDIKAIKAYMSKHNVKENKHTPPTVAPVIDNTCPFRNDLEKKCDIYPARPTICRLFKCDKGEMCDITKFKGEVNAYSMRSLFFNH